MMPPAALTTRLQFYSESTTAPYSPFLEYAGQPMPAFLERPASARRPERFHRRRMRELAATF